MYECAFDRGEECAALKYKECKGCHFRKTKEELEEGREKARKRIESMPFVEREHIKQKYQIR